MKMQEKILRFRWSITFSKAMVNRTTRARPREGPKNYTPLFGFLSSTFFKKKFPFL
jgi:hypothetical protein